MYSDRAFQIVAGLSWSQQVARPTRLADELVAAVQEAVPVTGVGLTWMSHGLPAALVAATDEQARRVEELQFVLGEGPCTRSAATGQPVLVEDLACAGSAWPEFSRRAVEVGVAAVFAFPLQVGRDTFGVLDLYRDTPGPLLPADLTEAAAFATVSTWVLLHLRPGLVDPALFSDLTERLAGRLEVHRAVGMLAAQLSLPVAEALTLLRSRASVDQRPISDVAQDLLAGL